MKLGRRALVSVALLAAATAIFAYFVWRGGAGDNRHSPIPEYVVPHLELAAGAPGRDAPFELIATPLTPAPASLKLVAFAFAMTEGDAEPNAVDAKIAVAPDGTVRLEGRSRSLSDARAREVRLVIGAATDFKRYEDALAAARAPEAANANVRVLIVPVVRVAPR